MLFRRLTTDSTYFKKCVYIKSAVLILTVLACLTILGTTSQYLIFGGLALFLTIADTRIMLLASTALIVASLYYFETNVFFGFGSILFALYFGCWMVILSHTTVHEIIKNKFLNRVVGEVSCAFMFIGFINFLYVHIMHHKHSDEEQDPHRNIPNVGFLKYTVMAGTTIAKTFQNYLPGFVCKNRLELNLVVCSVLVNRILIAQLFLLIFGPEIFAFFVVPAMITSHVFFAYINFYTHPNEDHSRTEIENVEGSLFQSVINQLFAGVLYHKVHHRYPQIYNPMKFAKQKAKVREQRSMAFGVSRVSSK